MKLNINIIVPKHKLLYLLEMFARLEKTHQGFNWWSSNDKVIVKLDINILYSIKKYNLCIIFLKKEVINYFVDGKF